MSELFKPFLMSFIALFVAIDVVAVIPIYMSITRDFTEDRRRKLLRKALITALLIALSFLISGSFIFIVFGITEADFKIGGGIVLLTISVLDLVTSNMEERRGANEEDAGVVPLGIPLIMGPAALTSVLVSSNSFGIIATLAALIVNLVIVWFVFRNSKYIQKGIGNGASKAVGKVASLFMTGIAVAMIRSGIQFYVSK